MHRFKLDFTIKTYRQLLKTLIIQGYAFQTFTEFLEKPERRCIILRHDVEAKYLNSLAIARIQNEFGIKGSYYFRFLPDHFDLEIIRQISSLGHEIGYHYDDLSHCKGDYKEALKRFEENLETLRKIAPVRTICMEGAPLSKYDNRDLWRRGEEGKRGRGEEGNWGYGDYGIIGEPYFDIDFSRVFYLTDTGRRWDGEKFSVRDKVRRQKSEDRSQKTRDGIQHSTFNLQHLKLHSSADIIYAANACLLPDQIMFTFHPQRWTDEPLSWIKELVLQNVKNVVKRMVLIAKGLGLRAEK